MVSKTITVTREAYDALYRHKRRQESFSELALRLTAGHGRLKDCWGLWKLSEKELEVFDGIKKAWDASDEEMKKKVAR
jgi:predicted CopG family antitoxin